MAMVTNGAGPAPLRLTRRGRLVVFAFLVLLASAASAVLLATASRASAPDVGAPPTVVVQPHETLWSIAARTAPRRDPYAAVAEIRRLNGLRDSVVYPGETLVLPRP
jgi:LysM repeat protein